MPHRKRASILLSSFTLGLCFALPAALSSVSDLRAQSSTSGENIFRNTDPSVAYVGSKSCGTSGCHEDINRTYFSTPHGQSMGLANSPTELRRVPKPITVFNQKNNRYYQVYQEGGNLYQSVYELDKDGRRIYSIAHKIDYVSGGESVGYTYMYRVGPWIFEAPLSYYVSSASWELSPGYVSDDHGFNRAMTTECLLCHNGQPDPVLKREGMYKEPPFRFGELGIGCEACHGPGAIHVKEMQLKKSSLLAPNEVDNSIVNPAKLPPRLANDLCSECHQAGQAMVLYPGKTVLDYRPGTPLAETLMIVVRPIKEEQRAEANRLEAIPPVRGSLEQPLWWKNSTMELSKCYQASQGQLNCGTCHSIHHAPRPEDEKAAYRSACLTCHNVRSCTLQPDAPARAAVKDDCVECHMEKRPVAGIAHSNDTKHRIVRFPGQPLPDVAFEKPTPDLPGLLWLNRPVGAAGERIPDLAQLDAYFMAAGKDPSLWPYWFKKLDELSKSAPNNPIVLNSLGALALEQQKDYAKAADDYARSLQQGSEESTTFMNLATALQNSGRAQDAEAVLERGVAAYPYSGQLVALLARQYFIDGETSEARDLVHQFRALFPEDDFVRGVQTQMDTTAGAGNPAAHSRNHSVGLPR